MFFTKSTDIARQLKFEILSFAEAEAASFYRLPKLEHKDPLRSVLLIGAIEPFCDRRNEATF